MQIKNKKSNYKIISVNLICIFLICGCTLAIRNKKEDNYSKPPKAEFTETTGKSILIKVNGKSDDIPHEYPDWRRNLYWWRNKYINDWKNCAERAYKDSQLFSKCDVIYLEDMEDDKKNMQSNNYDLIAEVTIERINLPNEGSSACLYSLTLGIVPYKTVNDISICTIYKTQEGTLLKRYEKDEKITMWYQLFIELGFIYLFTKSKWEIEREIYYDINMDIIKQANNDGFF